TCRRCASASVRTPNGGRRGSRRSRRSSTTSRHAARSSASTEDEPDDLPYLTMHARGVSDDAVWHAGNKTFADLARQCNCDKKSLHAELRRRGWRKAGKSGVTYQAPCAECGKPTRCGPADPGGLDGRRICRGCRNPRPVENEPEWKTWYRI